MDHSDGRKLLLVDADQLSDHGPMLIAMLGLHQSILTLDFCAGHLEISNHDFTLIEVLKLIKFILIVLKVIDLKLWHVLISLNCFQDVGKPMILNLLALLVEPFHTHDHSQYFNVLFNKES
jgi:hypothetical protein